MISILLFPLGRSPACVPLAAGALWRARRARGAARGRAERRGRARVAARSYDRQGPAAWGAARCYPDEQG